MYITRYKRVCQYFSRGKFAIFTGKCKTADAAKRTAAHAALLSAASKRSRSGAAKNFAQNRVPGPSALFGVSKNAILAPNKNFFD
jgi:hypothetical protein